MPSAQPHAGSQDSNGEDWDNPNKISVDVPGSPTVPLGHRDESNHLIASDFEFNVSGSITGIKVSIVAQSSGAGGSSHIVCHFVGLTLTADNQPATGSTTYSDDEPIGTTATTVVKGGATNTWGRTWTASEINSSNFGVIVSFENLTGSAEEILTCSQIVVEIF